MKLQKVKYPGMGRHIKELITGAGYSVTAFAKEIGIQYQNLQHLINGRIQSSRAIPIIANKLGVTVEYLYTGKTYQVPLPPPSLSGLKEVSKLPFSVGLVLVPVISWEDVNNWIMDNTMDSRVINVLEVSFKAGEKAYALKVENDLMTSPNPTPDSFFQGDYIVVDPDLKPRNGSFVIALLPDKKAIFRQYLKEGDSWWLKPLSPQYPAIPVTDGITIVGVIGGKYRPIIENKRED